MQWLFYGQYFANDYCVKTSITFLNCCIDKGVQSKIDYFPQDFCVI